MLLPGALLCTGCSYGSIKLFLILFPKAFRDLNVLLAVLPDVRYLLFLFTMRQKSLDSKTSFMHYQKLPNDGHRPWFRGSCQFLQTAPQMPCAPFPCFPQPMTHSPAQASSSPPLLQLFDQSPAGTWACLPHLLF